MTDPRSQFVFTLCQLGVEKDLKREMAERHPDLRAAFQRPGLVTFKHVSKELDLDVRIDAVLARAYGLSFGRAVDVDEIVAIVRERLPDVPTHVHVAPRDTVLAGEFDETARPPGIDAAEALRASLLATMPSRFVDAGRPKVSDLVLDVITSGDEPMLVGAHRHHDGHSPHPGGRLDQVLPVEAPSRAYLKLVESFDFAGEPLLPGRTAIEIGCAPGGAVFAMLERGMNVVGVDPGEMDPRIVAIGDADPTRFVHLAMPVGAVRESLLPDVVDYLLLDANLAPQVAFRSALRIAAMRKQTLRAMIFTLKMNDWSYLQNLAGFTERARELGFGDVRARQLATNRREVCFVAKRTLP